MSVVSLFADMTYEGGRSITGPFLAQLAASGTLVGIAGGFGELMGYGLRSIAGIAADRTGKYWIFAYTGYAINLLCVPALALAGALPLAIGLVIGERIGRGIRRPSSSAMLAHAGKELGYGWVFGFNELMDQTGATVGPLVVALMLFLHGGFRGAFGVLLIPAVLALLVLAFAWNRYPAPHTLEAGRPLGSEGLTPGYWTYLAAGAFVAAGIADFALISYHFSKAGIISNALIPIVYAFAMVVGAVTAPVFGRLYDRHGIAVVIGTFGLSAFASPLVFLGSSWPAILGMALWGLSMAAVDALLVSLVSQMVTPQRRATALGVFDTGFGFAWFAGSAIMGVLYDRSLIALVAFSLVMQLAALPIFALARARPPVATP
ncbi:MAG: MFS transporter [Candidatus Eremiobacteraeota bacterium]|nr:MFS transporter [Candidatus Eremiobacteraeota bacterium]